MVGVKRHAAGTLAGVAALLWLLAVESGDRWVRLTLAGLGAARAAYERGLLDGLLRSAADRERDRR